MQLPTVPTFVDADTSLLKLQQLSACAEFLGVADSYPMWHFYRSTTQTLTNSTWNVVAYDENVLDTDGVFTAGGLATIVTQGYYATQACVPVQSLVASWYVIALFQHTAGANNPHVGAGTVTRYGERASTAIAFVTSDEVLSPSAICPVVCYPGDTIGVAANPQGHDMTLDINNNAAYYTGRFVPNFTGRWIRTGT